MSDVIGRGVIEVSADSSKLNAAIAEARERLRGLGDAGQQSSNRSAASIDRYVRKLQEQNATLGKSKREIELYRLAMRGATDEQLRAANSALALREAWERQQNAIRDAARRQQQAMDDAAARTDRWHDRVTTAMRSVAFAAGAMAVASVYAFDRIATMAGDFQDLAEKTGDTAENLASLYVAAKVGGLEMDAVGAAIVKLNKNLSGLDEDSGDAARALSAIGLSVKDLQGKGGADQLTIIAQALNGYEESAKKSEVAMVLLGKSAANMLPFMKELGTEGGRQKVLTQEQIALADEYADTNARVSAELGLHAAAIATKLLPEVNKLMGDLSELAKDEEVVAAVTATMKGAFFAAITTFQAFALIGSDVAFTVRTIAREMDGLKRQATALQKLDFEGVRRIGKEVADAAAADRKRLDAFQRGIMKLTPTEAPPAPPAPAAKTAPGTKPPAPPKLKEIKYEAKGGKDKAGKSEAAQEAKARGLLEAEIAKAATDAVLNTYQNADRILSARRSAGLVDEREYYEAKAALIRLDADAQARALEADIARLSKSKATGKERIENERALVEARAKLAKLRENEAVSLELNADEQAARVREVAQAYVEAAAAAASYIETVKRQNARIVEGVGRGAKFRERQTGINQIEDKLTDRTRELDSDLRRKDITADQYAAYLEIARDTYRQEVAAFEDRTRTIEALQADGFNGMTEALANYADTARDFASMTEDAMSNALSGVEDYFVELATTGKASFSDLVKSIQADLVRISFRSLIGNAIDSFMGTAAGSGLQSLFGKAAPAANGAANAIGAATSAATAAGDVASQAAQTAALTASTAALTGQTASIAAATAATTASTASATALTAAEGAAAAAIAAASASSAAAMAVLTTSASAAATALAAVAASSGAKAGGDILKTVASAAVAGGRAIGGPVSAGSLYRVNEKSPELLTVAGKQYLMMGQQAGTVTPTATGGSAQQPINVNIHQSFAPGADRTTINQAAARSGMEARRALNRIS